MTQPSFDALYRSLSFEPLDIQNPSDEALYVKSLHKSAEIDPIDELRVNIEMSDKPSSWLFTGHKGVGKSTELRRMAKELGENNSIVILADVTEYLNIDAPISIEQLLITVAAAVADGASDILARQVTERSYAERLFDFMTNTTVDVKELGFKQAGFSFKTQLKQNPTIKDKILDSVAGAPAKLAQQVKDFIHQVKQEIHQQKGNKDIVLILDSLERLRVVGGQAEVLFDAIISTFDIHGEYLKLEHIDVVYSVPPYLPFLCPRIGSYFGVEVCTLPHVKVFTTPSELDNDTQVKKCEQGVARLIECVRQRYPDVEQLISEKLLARMALSTSGSLRDYFRLVRSVCAKAKVTNASTPLNNEELVAMAEQVLRNEMPLTESDKGWLRKVRSSKEAELDNMHNLHELARLFDSGIILNYRNGRSWCDVHYLLHNSL